MERYTFKKKRNIKWSLQLIYMLVVGKYIYAFPIGGFLTFIW